MKQLSIEMRNEIIGLAKNGHNQIEISESTGVSTATIRKYLKEAGVLTFNPRDKGGRISKTILVSDMPEKHEEAKEDDEILPVMLAHQIIEIAGTETMTTYRAETAKDYVVLEGEFLIGQIKINDIPKIIQEMKGVYNMVTRMKSNRWEAM